MSKEKIIKNLDSILAGISILTWFLPLVGMNARELGYSNVLSMSGFEAFWGMEFTDGTEISGNIISLFLVIFPLLLILSNYIVQLAKWKAYYMFVSPVGSVVCMFLTKHAIQEWAYVTVSASVGFWLYLIINVVLLVLAYFQYQSICARRSVPKFMEQPSGNFTNVSQNSEGLTCPNCGGKVTRGKKFCNQCGTKLPEEEKTEVKKCQVCGYELSDTHKFCPECGGYIDKTMAKCAKCGIELEDGVKFCPECGEKLARE